MSNELKQLVLDLIETHKAYGRPVPQNLLDKLAELEGQEIKPSEAAGAIIPGNPLFDTPYPEIQYLIPIKVNKDSDLSERFDRAQKLHDELARKIFTAEEKVKTAKSPSKKRIAVIALSKLGREQIIFDFLRHDILPELNRLQKIIDSLNK